jgi:uncharacterized membrane protein YtjA (UPF0391 family)
VLQWTVIFFVIAIVTALFGMRGVASTTAKIAYLLAILAVATLLLSLVSGAFAIPLAPRTGSPTAIDGS